MTASVPAFAPVMPPLTGESTQPIWRSASLPATSVATPGPVVDRSIISRTFEPLMMPALPPSATSRTMSGVGRLTSTISACEATSAGEAAICAPRAAKGFIASARDVVDAQFIARIEQTRGHRPAHPSDADEAHHRHCFLHFPVGC